MEIVKYELTKKNIYNVYLSNGEVLELDESVITNNELLLKKRIDNDLYDKLKRDNKICILVNASIKYINVRLRSIKEIKDYLLKKEDDTDLIDEVISRLIKMGYLDDRRFTEAYIKDKLNFTSWGDYKIINELNKLGISSLEEPWDVIEEDVDDDILNERMRKIIDKDIRTNKKYSGLKLKNKIYNHLLTSGYSKEKAISLINSYDF